MASALALSMVWLECRLEAGERPNVIYTLLDTELEVGRVLVLAWKTR